MALCKTNKYICKSRKDAKRINSSLKGTLGLIQKLQCRGAPQTILTIIRKLPSLTPNAIRTLTFSIGAQKFSANFFVDRQVEQAMMLKNKKEFEANLTKKQSILTNISSNLRQFAEKENFVEQPKHSSRPQEAEAAFI